MRARAHLHLLHVLFRYAFLPAYKEPDYSLPNRIKIFRTKQGSILVACARGILGVKTFMNIVDIQFFNLIKIHATICLNFVLESKKILTIQCNSLQFFRDACPRTPSKMALLAFFMSETKPSP